MFSCTPCNPAPIINQLPDLSPAYSTNLSSPGCEEGKPVVHTRVHTALQKDKCSLGRRVKTDAKLCTWSWENKPAETSRFDGTWAHLRSLHRCQKSHRSCEREKSQKQDKDHRDYQSFLKDITKSKFWKHIQNTANHTCSNLKTLCPVLSLILTIWLQQTEKPKPYLNNSLQPHGTLIAS